MSSMMTLPRKHGGRSADVAKGARHPRRRPTPRRIRRRAHAAGTRRGRVEAGALLLRRVKAEDTRTVGIRVGIGT